MACGRTVWKACLSLAASVRRGWLGVAGGLFFTLAIGAPQASIAAALKTVLTVGESDGYARLIFSADDDIDASVRMTGNVLIISFKREVDVPVDRISSQAS